MKKPDRLKLGAAMGMALALVFYAGTGAWAQLDTDLPGGHLKIQTALEMNDAAGAGWKLMANDGSYTEIGYDTEADRQRYHVTDSGIVIVVRQESLIEEPESA